MNPAAMFLRVTRTASSADEADRLASDLLVGAELVVASPAGGRWVVEAYLPFRGVGVDPDGGVIVTRAHVEGLMEVRS